MSQSYVTYGVYTAFHEPYEKIINESSGESGPVIDSTLELDLETVMNEFPDETLVYMSNKMNIGMDDEKREKEYNCFKVWKQRKEVNDIITLMIYN